MRRDHPASCSTHEVESRSCLCREKFVLSSLSSLTTVFTLSTEICARVIEKGTVYREGDTVSFYIAALEMVLKPLLHSCVTTFECRSQ